MRTGIRIALLGGALGVAVGTAYGQGCEAAPEVSAALKAQAKESREMRYSERTAYRRKGIEDLLRKYPREAALGRRLMDFIRYEAPDDWPALRESSQQRAAQNPNDPLAVYLAGYALVGHNTPEGIRLMERAKTLDAGFPWAYLSLARLYSSGKFADRKKTAENLAGYFRICPETTRQEAHDLLARFGSAELQTIAARRLRERLARESNPEELKNYSALWALEFRTRPVVEHPQVRKQVAEDVKRLEKVNAKPDAAWLDLLKSGMKQGGASAEAVRALDDRILREFPSSEEALGIVRERWRKEHPDPRADDSAEVWETYQRTSIEAARGWMRQFPKQKWLIQAVFFPYSSLPSVPRKTAVEVGGAVLKAIEDDFGPDGGTRVRVAEFYLKNKIETKRALELIESAQPLVEKEWRRRFDQDTLKQDTIDELRKYENSEKQHRQELLLKAYARLKRVEEARRLKPELEGPAPKDPGQASTYWANRARLAEMESHVGDALAYYQRALQARPKAPGKRYGRVEDPLLDDARNLWRSVGGTDTAFAMWSKPAAGAKQELSEGRWERPKKDLPAFELTDLSGKVWGSKTLQGKTLLINVWATWCGFCLLELPKLEKLRERLKDRTDVAIFTMNVDDEVGLVEPFMKEKGYTFPVLLAYQFVANVLDSIAIPRNWIVDAKGKWQWEQLGFDSSDADWEGSMIAKIESVRRAKNAQ